MKELEYYRHQLHFDYPERSDEQMIKVKHLRDTHFDENYKYLPKGFWHKIKRGILWLALNLIAFPICTLRYGVKIHKLSPLQAHKILV